MKLTSMFMQNIQVNSTESTSAVKTFEKTGETKNDSFKNYLNRNEKADKAATNKNVSQNTSQKKDNAVSNNNMNNKPVSKDTAKIDESKKDANVKPNTQNTENKEAVKTDGTKVTQEQTVKSLEDANNELVQKIAAIFGIPVEMLKQILEQMNIQPEDLLITENLNELVQTVYGAETQIDLLNIDGIKDVLTEINKVLDEYADEAIEFAKVLETLKAEVKPEKAVVSDNEAVVVTDKVMTGTTENVVTDNDSDIIPVNTETEAKPKQVQPTNNSEQNANNSLMNQNQSAPQENKLIVEIKNDINGAVTANTELKAEAVAVRNEAVRNINTADVIQQIVSKIKVEAKADMTEVKIKLNPEHLGDVTLKVTTQNGIVTAQFYAESQRVKEIIEAGFAQLRESLQDQGVNISELNVTVGQEENAQQQLFGEEQKRSSARIQSILSGIMGDDEQIEVVNELDIDTNGAFVNYRV